MKTLFLSLRHKKTTRLAAGIQPFSLNLPLLRRRWLSVVSIGWLAWPAWVWASGTEQAVESNGLSNKSAQQVMDAAVDVLIPQDPTTPSASRIGVGAILLQQAASDEAFRPWLVAGMAWLDQGVPGNFAQRSATDQLALIETLAAAPVGSQMRIFFELLRLRTMTAYYADPRARASLVINRPPQPLGYPDFAGPV